MSTIDEFNNLLQKFHDSPEGVAEDFRNSFSLLLVDCLRARAMTQKELSEKSGVAQKTITKLIHGAANFSADTVGKLLHALGERAEVVRAADPIQSQFVTSVPEITQYIRYSTIDSTWDSILDIRENSYEEECTESEDEGSRSRGSAGGLARTSA